MRRALSQPVRDVAEKRIAERFLIGAIAPESSCVAGFPYQAWFRIDDDVRPSRANKPSAISHVPRPHGVSLGSYRGKPAAHT